MPSLVFWNNWPATWKRIGLFAAGIFIFSCCFMWFSWFQGNDGIIHWEKIQEQKTIETTVHAFRLGPFELRIPGESYVIFEYLQGSEISHNTTASYLFLFLLLAAAMLLLTVITTLPRFWFFGGITLFILFIVSLRLDALQIFGQEGITVPAIVLGIFLLISYVFNSIRPETAFATRLLTFMAMALALVVVVYFFAAIPFPLLYLAMAAYTPALVLSILFVITVAHEILASFVYVSSQGNTKSLRHFMIISLIYMINLLLTCLHEMGTIGWDFIYINLYLLLTLSAILGLWGFKLRENLYENIFAFSPAGAFFFLALGSICFIWIGQLLGNGNDAALKVVRDMIIFAHTAFGIIFLTYIVSNFMVMMASNLPVHKVLYRPNRMPYFTFRLAGVIITLAFIFVSYWRDYVDYSRAGFYNYAGDLYQMQGNETFARALYERSRANAFRNHRANYALGMMKASRLDFTEAHENFDLANRQRPSDYSMVNQGNLYLWHKNYFPAIRHFRSFHQTSSSDALANNLAFAYTQVHNLDSAMFYINKARQNTLTRTAAETNFFGLVATELIPVDADSIVATFDTRQPGVISNAIAAATLFNQPLQSPVDPLAARELDLHTATLLNNYIIQHARSLDTTFTRKAFALADDSLNRGFSEAIKASLAYASYHQGNVYKAQEILAELVYLSQSYQGKYNYIMGLWALEQGSPLVAADYFTHATWTNYKDAKLYYAIALTEAGSISDALVAWDSVISAGGEQRVMAEKIRRILTLDPSSALRLPDAEKYQYARYMVSPRDTAYFAMLVSDFENPNYKAQALLDMSIKQLKRDNTRTAVRFLNQVNGLELTDKSLYDKVRHLELLILAGRNDVGALAKKMNAVDFEPSRFLQKLLYTALISQAQGDTTTAEENFSLLGSWNPYFEEGILAAADYYRDKDPDGPRAYDILVEAIQINASSVRLLKAYAAEASRQGFDGYAANAVQRLMELERN